MSQADVALVVQLPDLAFMFVLLLARVGCASMLLPGFGEAELPMPVRAGLAVALVALIGPAVSQALPALPREPVRVAAMVVAEAVTGLWLGWLARLVLLSLPVAGQFIASVAGLANVLQPDPTLGAQTSAVSHLLGLAAPIVVFSAGLHVMVLSAIESSYRLIAPGTLLPAADTAAVAVRAVADSFGVALRLAAPFVLAGTLWNVALAVLGRLVPNLQVFFVASPGQILGGLILLGLLGTTLVAVWQGQAATALAGLPGL